MEVVKEVATDAWAWCELIESQCSNGSGDGVTTQEKKEDMLFTSSGKCRVLTGILIDMELTQSDIIITENPITCE